ncbi:MAG: hypothetical protein HJJLKODD_00924 [Phycisphaerae bacterium]|nr:hypothetical protein [Phycisphaerae bacterium]
MQLVQIHRIGWLVVLMMGLMVTTAAGAPPEKKPGVPAPSISNTGTPSNTNNADKPNQATTTNTQPVDNSGRPASPVGLVLPPKPSRNAVPSVASNTKPPQANSFPSRNVSPTEINISAINLGVRKAPLRSSTVVRTRRANKPPLPTVNAVPPKANAPKNMSPKPQPRRPQSNSAVNKNLIGSNTAVNTAPVKNSVTTGTAPQSNTPAAKAPAVRKNSSTARVRPSAASSGKRGGSEGRAVRSASSSRTAPRSPVKPASRK